MKDEIYYTEEAGEYANNIQVGDVVAWQSVHGGRSVQVGRIGCVAAISEDRMVATVVDGSLSPDVDGWNRHEVVDVKMARLGKVNVDRYAKFGLFANA